MIQQDTPLGGALSLVTLACLTSPLAAQAPPGESPALTPPRITQSMIESGSLTVRAIRTHGLRMFATPFNKIDGYGDGPMDPANPTDPGGRPTLQNNGTFLRVNGLDAQTCMECHSVMSTATVPFRFGIAGVGGANNNAMFGTRDIDVDDTGGNGFAAFDGRFINPPFLLGSGGVELAGKEMTERLQQLREHARRNQGQWIDLHTKGVSFGQIRCDDGTFDLSRIEGIDDDLVVRPFGRKGEFATTRGFDVGALPFHFGMQPVEVVGRDIDGDNDGVANEVLIGEVSALSIFNTTLERPIRVGRAPQGRRLFRTLGCAECHVPELQTTSPVLTYSFPEVDTDPSANVYYAVDLRQAPPRFRQSPRGGIRVPLFSDLKRHDMGPGLAENLGNRLDPFFVTARLWGVADTGPWLHDGRALTLTDAILLHGGEAQRARDAFANLSPNGRVDLLKFLRTLRTPPSAAGDLEIREVGTSR